MNFQASALTEIRQNFLNRRNALSAAEVLKISRQIVKKWTGHSLVAELRGAKKVFHVGVYNAIGSEVSLDSFEQAAYGWGWKLYYPKIIDSVEKILEFIEIKEAAHRQQGVHSSSKLWNLGPFGIREPRETEDGGRAFPPAQLDLMIVPGVAFSESGERIGMGGGYYDRFLPRAKHALRVSFAYDFQVTSRLPQKTTDQPVHWVMTESREFKTPFVEQWWSSQKSQPKD